MTILIVYAHTAYVKTRDPLLVEWGRQIRSRREALTADGQLRGEAAPAMTQEQLGALMDPPVDQSTVARWENGDIEPRRHYKAQLSSLFHTDGQFLFPMKAAS